MRRALIIAGSLVVAGCLPTSGTGTGDVPTYRGDSGRTGVMPGPGPSGEPRMAWQFQADSLIRSSPTVSGGAVFVSTEGGLVHALELSTGAERWRSEVGAEGGVLAHETGWIEFAPGLEDAVWTDYRGPKDLLEDYDGFVTEVCGALSGD